MGEGPDIMPIYGVIRSHKRGLEWTPSKFATSNRTPVATFKTNRNDRVYPFHGNCLPVKLNYHTSTLKNISKNKLFSEIR